MGPKERKVKLPLEKLERHMTKFIPLGHMRGAKDHKKMIVTRLKNRKDKKKT